MVEPALFNGQLTGGICCTCALLDGAHLLCVHGLGRYGGKAIFHAAMDIICTVCFFDDRTDVR